MIPVLSRRRIAVGAAVLAVAGAGAGTAAVRASSGSSSQLTASSSTSTPTATPAAPSPAPHKHRLGGERRVGKVVTETATTLTIVDAKGTQTQFAVGPRTRVTGPGGAKEDLSALKSGEVVVVAARDARLGTGRAGAGTSPSPLASTGSAGPPVAVLVVDTGFLAAG